MYLASFLLFGLGQVQVIRQGALATYWILKFLYVYVALLISIFLTILWEEWIVASIAAKGGHKYSFLRSTTIANLITLALLMVWAAAHTLPERLARPDFLVELTNALRYIGVTL